MMNFIQEMRRRNVFRAAVAYTVVSWIMLQVAEILAPILKLPDWAVSAVFFFILLGFPFALIFAWAFELTPEGLKKTSEVSPEESIAGATGSTLNKVIMGVMALAIVLLLGERFIPYGKIGPQPEEAATSSAKSIAVLPFVNMSNDPDQEYFSDGISEELLNSLAKIAQLRVAARTSAFEFKGQNRNVTEIGELLSVDTVLEGSVRKSGNRVRITAQLINVDTGYHLWSETYDRDLVDIFVIQDEISAAIVKALRVHLLDEPSVVAKPVLSVEAYNFYLLGRKYLRTRTKTSLEEAIKSFDQVLELAPDYAAAYALKSQAVLLLGEDDYGDTPEDVSISDASAIAARALELDPESAEAHAANGLIWRQQDRYEEALRSLNRAIELKPSEGIYYVWKSHALNGLGRSEEAGETLWKAFELDPLHKVVRSNLLGTELRAGNYERMESLLVKGTADYHHWKHFIAEHKGEFAEAYRHLISALSGTDEAEKADFTNRLERFRFYVLMDLNLDQVKEPLRRLDFGVSLDPDVAPDFSNLPEGYICPLSQNCEEIRQDMLVRHYLATENYPAIIQLYQDVELTPVATHQSAFQTFYIGLAMLKMQDPTGLDYVRSFEQHFVQDHKGDSFLWPRTMVAAARGDQDLVLQLLAEGLEAHQIDWDDLRARWLDPVKDTPEFRAIESSYFRKLNEERVKLGWEPVPYKTVSEI